MARGRLVEAEDQGVVGEVVPAGEPELGARLTACDVAGSDLDRVLVDVGQALSGGVHTSMLSAQIPRSVPFVTETATLGRAAAASHLASFDG